ncbi:helix-turn-helix domain-containing protein (plasmid) [Exiguobacterium mexicanum]|uniref:helix-turn-helix domain-containing protein n=1 Tax=Exiguobacterium mexicanum TaxID=340146 RepID=UPI003AB6447C
MSENKIVVMTERQVEELIQRTIRETLADQANFQRRWVTVNEACEYLSISRWTLDQKTRTGKIKSYKIDSMIRYLVSDLDDALLND